MVVLASHGIIHRDLALRNILVMSYGASDAAAVHVKVCLFCVSLFVYLTGCCYTIAKTESLVELQIFDVHDMAYLTNQPT